MKQDETLLSPNIIKVIKKEIGENGLLANDDNTIKNDTVEVKGGVKRTNIYSTKTEVVKKETFGKTLPEQQVKDVSIRLKQEGEISSVDDFIASDLNKASTIKSKKRKVKTTEFDHDISKKESKRLKSENEDKTSSESLQTGSRFECKECDFVAKRKKTLETHQNFVHKNIRFCCDVCKRPFALKANLITHQKSIHGGMKYACDICDYKAAQKGTLDKHQASVHADMKYKCNICDAQYKWPTDLYAHKDLIHGSKQYECNICNKVFKSKRYLNGHIRNMHTNEEERNFPCDHCDYHAKTKGALKIHKQAIHYGVTYPCNKCLNTYSSSSVLKRHKREVHEREENGNFKCDFCEYDATRKNLIDEHKERYHKKSLHQCETCSYEAPTEEEITKHKELLQCFLFVVNKSRTKFEIDGKDVEIDEIEFELANENTF